MRLVLEIPDLIAEELHALAQTEGMSLSEYAVAVLTARLEGRPFYQSSYFTQKHEATRKDATVSKNTLQNSF